MILSLKNIGKIKKASVELNGITVIAGENNTGKSTVGRALFSVFNSFYNIEEQIKQERLQSLNRLQNNIYLNATGNMIRMADTVEMSENILNHIDKYVSDPAAIKNEVMNSLSHYDGDIEKYIEPEQMDEMINRILEIISISDDDIFKTVLSKKISAEFSDQVTNIFTEEAGEIELQIKNHNVSILITENKIAAFNNRFELKTEAIYIDDPFILDEQRHMPIFRAIIMSTTKPT